MGNDTKEIMKEIGAIYSQLSIEEVEKVIENINDKIAKHNIEIKQELNTLWYIQQVLNKKKKTQKEQENQAEN